MPEQPALIIHTGDITHLSKAAEFDTAQQLFSRLKTGEMHTVPGEHDTTDATVTEYFNRFGRASDNKGYYSFDHAGVHFVGLINVLQFKPGGSGNLGAEQLAWVAADLKARSASTPIVVFAHMPLWTIYEPWGWGTGDADQLIGQLRRFGSVTILNGHIHQIVQKVEGNLTFHTARSTAYPQPAAGEGPGPGPLKVPADQLSQNARHYQRLDVQTSSGPVSQRHDDCPTGSKRKLQRGIHMRLKTISLPLMAAAMAAIWAVSEAAAPNSIEVKNFMFTPTTLTVNAGAQVSWVNKDDEPHTVVSDTGLFRSGALDTDESFSFKFDKAGHLSLHLLDSSAHGRHHHREMRRLGAN